jgi:hypothetical protein
MSHEKRTRIKDLFQGSGLTFIVVFAMEMVEEGLENLIALGISTLFSTVLLVCFTQLTKLGLKKLVKFIMPFVKKLIYKEGKDKMELLKKYWTKVWGNKITGTSVGLGFAGISYFQTLIPFAHQCWWIALIVFVVFYNLGIFFGGETLNQIQERLANAVLTKEQNSIMKEAKKKLAQQMKEATQSEAEKQKADAEAKAKAERDAKVNQAINQLKAEQSKK